MPMTTLQSLIEDIKADASEYMRAKMEIMQLKAAEKGSPIAAKGVYMIAVGLVVRILVPLVLLTSLLALSLLFVSTLDALEVLRALTFGSLCLLGLFLLILFILMLMRSSIIARIESKIVNSVIDEQEQAEAEKNKHLAIPQNTSVHDDHQFGAPKKYE